MAVERGANVFTVYNCPACGVGSLFPKIIAVRKNGRIKVMQCLSPGCENLFEIIRPAIDHIGKMHSNR